MKPPTHPVARLTLGVLGRIYAAVTIVRNRYYDRPSSSRRVDIPVLAVGNLTVGGTGKTTLVSWLARRLLEMGRRPAIVSRGYGGTSGRGPRVVSDGHGPLAESIECGDEPLMLARSLVDVSVIVGSDRTAGARLAARMGSDVVVLDDGFQHRRLARDLDVVLLDAGNPFGNHAVLPRGPLREPVSGLSRADVVVLTRSRRDEPLESIERVVRLHNPDAPLLLAGHRAVGFFDSEGSPVEPPARAVAFCGIGSPDRFRFDLEQLGIELALFESFRDHHRYRVSELRRLVQAAARLDAALVTTEKDRVRLSDTTIDRAGARLVTLRIEAEVFDPDPLLNAVRRVLS